MRRALEVATGGLALILAAFAFDAAPLFVAGFAFLAVGLGAPAWIWLSARRASLRRELSTERVTEREPFESTIEISRGPLGLPGAELHDPLSGSPVTLSLPLSLLGGSRQAAVRVVTRFGRRGLRKLEPPTLRVSDPLGLVSIECRGAGARQELLVLPYTEPIRWDRQERARRAESWGGPTPGDPLAAIDVDGLRPYQPGTPASRIHWPALARGAGLLERRLRADGDSRPLVVLDARGSGPEEELDAAVRATASLTLELARRYGCRLLLPGERRAVVVERDMVAWPSVHARLALIEGGSGARAPMVDPGVRAGALFYVSAKPVERLPAALALGGRATSVLVLPKGVKGIRAARPSFEVTGCHGFVIRSRAGAPVERVA